MRDCFATNGCGWAQFGGCVPSMWSSQATLFNIIPSDSDGHDHKLLTKGRPNEEGYAVDVDMDIDSTGHSDSGDDVSDEYDDDLYLYEDEDMDEEDEDVKTDFNSHQKTRLRGSASPNTYFSAISVGDGSRRSRPTCRELQGFRNRCMERSDCRLICQGNLCRCGPK